MSDTMLKRLRECEHFIDTHFMDNGDTSYDGFEKRVDDTQRTLEDLTRQVTQQSLFSPNEHYRELPPKHLPFLLLPAYLGLLATSERDKHQRVNALRAANIYFKDFLTRTVSYEICDLQLPWASDEGVGDDTAQAEPRYQRTLPTDPKVARQQKINAFKAAKEQEVKLKQMAAQVDSADEDTLRELYLTRIRYWANRALQELHSIEIEIPMAQRMAEIMRDAANTGGDTPLSTAQETRIARETSRPLAPIIITRDATQKAVFGAGYPSVPALTVDEWYRSMVRDGYFPDPHQRQPSSSRDGATQQSDEDESDERVQRQRAMDEYRDDHRRGWGNTHNKG